MIMVYIWSCPSLKKVDSKEQRLHQNGHPPGGPFLILQYYRYPVRN